MDDNSIRLEELKKIILNNFAFREIELIDSINKGNGAKKFYIRADGGKYCLRINLPFFSSKAQANFRADILDQLRQENINAPYMLRTIEKRKRKARDKNSEGGIPFFIWDKQLCEIQSWVDSESSENRKSLTESDISSILHFANNLLVTLQGISSSHDYLSVPNYELDYVTSYIPFFNVGKVLEKITNMELIKFQTVVEYVNDNLYRLNEWLKTSSLSIIHGDLHTENIGFIDDEACVIYDFESLRWGYLYEDIYWLIADLFDKKIQSSKIAYERFYQHSYNILLRNLELSVGSFELFKVYLLHRHASSLWFHLRSLSENKYVPFEIVTKHKERLKLLSGMI